MRRIDKEVLLLEPDDICPMDDNPRQHFDPKFIEHLRRSLKFGQVQEVRVVRIQGAIEKPHFKLIAGEYRWRASCLDKMPLEAIVDPPADPITLFERACRENVRSEIAPYDKLTNCMRLVKDTDYSAREIAHRLGMKESTVKLYTYIGRKLCPELIEHLRPNLPKKDRMRLMSAYELSRYTPEEQKKHAPKLLGMSDRRATTYLRLKARTSASSNDGARRGRKPVQDYLLYQSAMNHFLDTMRGYARLLPYPFERMFMRRSKRAITKTIAEITEAITLLSAMKKRMKALQKIK